jgi:Protein of unknown function (DUF3617)
VLARRKSIGQAAVPTPTGTAIVPTTQHRATHRLVRPSLLLALALSTAPAFAQKIAPGLWEQTTQIQGADGAATSPMAGLQAQLAKLPPAQRQQMEAMMASKGAGIAPGQAGIRMCISPEQAAGGQVGKPEPGCTQQVAERSAQRVRMVFECAGPPPRKGEAEYSFSGDKAYTGRMRITEGGAQGRSMEMQMSGRWIGADCGNLKPAGAQKPG